MWTYQSLSVWRWGRVFKCRNSSVTRVCLGYLQWNSIPTSFLLVMTSLGSRNESTSFLKMRFSPSSYMRHRQIDIVILMRVIEPRVVWVCNRIRLSHLHHGLKFAEWHECEHVSAVWEQRPFGVLEPQVVLMEPNGSSPLQHNAHQVLRADHMRSRHCGGPNLEHISSTLPPEY